MARIERPSDAELDLVIHHVPSDRHAEVRRHAEVNSSGAIFAPLPNEVWLLESDRARLLSEIADGIADETVFVNGVATDWDVTEGG